MTDEWGIDDGYWDIAGTWQPLAEHARRALRGAVRADEHPAGPPAGPPLWFVGRGETPALTRPARLVLEDGAELRVDSHLPPDIPIGHHDLHPADHGPTTRLVVSPRRCHLPDDVHSWGWAVQLYALRSAHSWGIGDLHDLARFGQLAREMGATTALVSPLHAPVPSGPQQASPYYPSSRLWRNPLHLDITGVPGFDTSGLDLPAEPGDDRDLALLLGGIAAAGRALDRDPLVDRDRVWDLKRAALEVLWARDPRRRDDPTFRTWRADQGVALECYARHAALADHHGAVSWPQWPDEHRHPGSPAVEHFARVHADRVAFHAWVQWLLDGQLRSAGTAIDLVTDLAVGVDPGGADAWRWQDLYAQGVRVGAPPDEFNTAGQDWGLPPFIPWALRGARYEPFVEALRASLRHASGLRIDHVMGLFRLYWVTGHDGGTATGGYVRYRADELLDLVAIESVRAGAIVAGEDLGTVEAGVRDDLGRRGLLSTRLVWFEDEPPSRFPPQSLAALTTHDLPTAAGLLDGADADERRAIGQPVDPRADDEVRDRLLRAAAEAGVDPGRATTADIVAAAHHALAAGPAAIVVATLDDALGVELRPNVPGTVDERPNWSRAAPCPIEELAGHPGIRATVAAMEPRRGDGQA